MTDVKLGFNATLCKQGIDVSWILSDRSGCDVTRHDVLSSSLGFLAAPLWLLGHFLLYAAQRSKRQHEGRLPAWITWSLLPHCVADVMSCVGAVLARQLFSQIVFAWAVFSVHCCVALVLMVRHIACQRTKYDLRSETIVEARYMAKGRSGCFLPVCVLALFTGLCLGFTDVTAIADVAVRDVTSSHVWLRQRTVLYDGTQLSWRDVLGEVLGAAACLGHWTVSAYEIIKMLRYKSSRRHARKKTAGVFLMMTGNAAYLASVLWRVHIPWLRSLPWTVTRSGLLGLNTGMMIQLWRKTRRKVDNHLQHDNDGDYSLISGSSGSDAETQSDVLWDSSWRKRMTGTSAQADYHRFQPLMPALHNGGKCLIEGRSPQPTNRSLPFDLFQSSDTSCSRTADRDTEVELELSSPRSGDFGVQIPPALHMPSALSPSYYYHHHRHHRQLDTSSPLTPEVRHHRVVQWVSTSFPEDDDIGQAAAVFGGREFYRQHSGSFSQAKSPCKDLGLTGLHESRPRKNSAIF